MKDREHISEAHRQRHLIEEKKNKRFITSLLLALFLSIGFYLMFKEVLYTKEDREKLKLIQQYRTLAYQIKDQQEYERYMEYLREEEEKIKEKYPFPSLWSLPSYPGNKLLFVFVSLLPLFSFIGLAIYLKKRLFPQWDSFVLPTVKQEEVMKLPPKGSNLWGERYRGIEEKFIKDVETVKRLFASLEIKDMERAEKFIEGLMKEVARFLKEYFPYENHKELLFCVEFLLFHHLASLYGNLPTSLLGKYIKDYNLRKALSLYQRNHLPVITGVDGRLLKNEESAFILCKIFYTLDKHLLLRRKLDENFDPLRNA